MAVPGVKYDDGSANFATNCFPVRTLSRFSDEGTERMRLIDYLDVNQVQFHELS